MLRRSETEQPNAEKSASKRRDLLLRRGLLQPTLDEKIRMLKAGTLPRFALAKRSKPRPK